MATNKVSIGIDISDNGSAVNLIKKVKNLKDLLTQTASIASSINVGGMGGRTTGGGSSIGGTGGGSSIGGTGGASGGSSRGSTGGGSSRGGTGSAGGAGGAGSGSPGPRSGPSPAPSGGAAGPANPSGGGTYGQARSTFGTGAGARDFARQSEGLGGLVRLYATFAANIFAVAAAFRALSTSMDTTNMVAGLDQLGAQSGKSLGGVAKNLVTATGGAISLREAMTATAQASAAGMSSKDIIRLGEAARRASAILGVDMTDALSRLSRGITKIEPELLDELGIFTKITQSNEEYARKLGKSALALTDFEKRQGFANAVLAEAETKFGTINVDVNPYSQLSASLKNVSQSTLEYVNDALGPMVKLLSESPSTLMAGLALSGGILLNQAIPALSQFGTKLRETAEDAERRSTSIADTLRNLGPRPGAGGLDLQRISLERIQRQATATATSLRTLSNAVDNTRLLGARSAFALLRAEIAATGAALTATQQRLLLFRGVAAIAVTAVGTLVSAFGGAIAKIAGFIAIIGLLGSWLGKNAKYAAAAGTAMDTLADAISNVDRTIKAINAKPLLQQLSVDSLAARATAFQGLTNSMVDSINKVEEEIANRNWMDSFTNFLTRGVGKDTETKLANNLARGFEKAFKIAGSTLDLTDFKKDLAETLSMPEGTSDGALLAAIKAATPEVRALATKKLDALTEEFNTAAQGAKDFNTQMLGTSKLYDEIALKYQTTDNSAKFGERQAKDALALNQALGSTNTAIAAMISIAGSVDKLKLFEPADAEVLLSISGELNKLGEQYQENNRLLDAETESLRKINEQIAEKQRLLDDIKKGRVVGRGMIPEVEEEIKVLTKSRVALPEEVSRRTQLKSSLESSLNVYTKLFSAAATNSFVAGSARVTAAIQEGFAKSKTIIQEATLSLFPENKATILEQASIAKAQLQSDINKITSDNNLIDSQERLRIAFETKEVAKGVIARDKGEKGAITVEEEKVLEKLLSYQTKLVGIGNKFKTEDLDEYNALAESLKDKPVSQAIMTGFSGTLSLINKKSGTQSTLDIKTAEGIAIEIKTAGKIRAQDSKENVRLIDAAISSIDKSSQILQQRLGGMTTTEGLSAQQGLASDKRQAEASKAEEPVLQAVRSAGITGDKKQLQESFKVLDNLQKEQAAIEATARVVDEIALSKAQIAETMAKQNMLDEANLQLSETAAQVTKSRSELSAKQLDYDYSIGKINKDTYDGQKRTNAIKEEEVNLAQTLLQIESKRKKDTAGLSTQLNHYTISGAKRTQLEEEFDLVNKVAGAEADRAIIEKALRVEGIRLGEEMNERTTTYADAFNNTVNSMSDALVDFAMTGKASFGDMIESMIIDLIKFEQRQMMMAAYQGMGGSGSILGAIGSSIGASLFGPSMASAGELANFSGYGSANSGLGAVQPTAKGGVFDQGRTNFAMGGAFTNTIVTRPTTFAFAKGAGLMGESGPEAIMPLKRSANGSLGIQGGSTGNVDVVVNNYGSEKAQTKESTDARGNRKIEVIIGEMTAAEMNRPNSPVQSSMRNTFGLAPSLTRR